MSHETDIQSLVVVSDIHAGCRMGLCPPEGVRLDDGGFYRPSHLQLELWSIWREMWDEWVPRVTRGEPYGVVFNGDAVDGVHHKSTTQVSHNLNDQVAIARSALAPIVDGCGGRYWHVRGTEAHVGPSAADEERLARDLGAIPNQAGQHARWELYKRIGQSLVHFTHHIGTTGSQSYEATAIGKEMVEAFVEAGRWGDEPPQVIVRSHRHRYMEIRMATEKGYGISLVTPGWQLKTPYVHRIAARQSQPQVGMVLLRHGDEEFYSRACVKRIERTAEG